MFDVLSCLQNDASDLLCEDLDMLAEELATGGYEREYRNTCEELIAQFRKQKDASAAGVQTPDPADGDSRGQASTAVGLPTDISQAFAPAAGLSPFNAPQTSTLSRREGMERDLAAMRRSAGYKEMFKKYLETDDFADVDFFVQNIALFTPWELDCALERLSLPEDALEKYFSALNSEKIAQYQVFSEAFFMRHYQELDARIVLCKGKNDWRAKEKRSKQLDVFLRLKGVSF